MQHEKEILKWVDGSITEAELSELRKTSEFKTLEPMLKRMDNFKKPSLNVNEALENFNKLKQPKSKVVAINPWKKYISIAASILLLASLFFAFYNFNTVVTTQYAENTVFHLPDNSEVALNSGSEISYVKNNWNTKRELTLKGEAFFKVSKGKTFDVITEQGTVTVVGTQFNVKERENYFEVSCYEGKVKVSVADEVAMLVPGKSIRLVAGELSNLIDFKSELPDWIQKESNFKNTPFVVVVEELERQFNVKISFDKALENKKFTGGFSYLNLQEALESITFPMNLNYRIKETTVELYE